MIELWDIVDEHGNRTGKTMVKGTPMKKGEYHLSVSVWIQNDAGDYLVSQRVPTKIAPNMWETTGGAAISGEDSLSAALRETKEELGVTLYPENGRVLKSYTYPHSSGDGAAYIEVWLFRQNIDIETVVLQKEETCDVKWASKEQIKQMMDQNIFIKFDYIDELFAQS
ncbi:MAG TPA: NUDIX domain-containing protein [Candidatus Merdivicinus intestinigallinarum]|nr:NUDIX domain-containing protein [Candidatus Merdivicinus intestinigallinarum]